MFATPVCVGVMMAGVLSDPLLALQLRYPATRTTITTTTGTEVYYSLPFNAPAELKRAYKVLQVAEREVLVSETLQLLEKEYVQNERRLEALRTARTATYLTNTIYGNRGPLFYSSALLSPPEPALKWVLSGSLVQGTTVDRALVAIDRMTTAQYQLQQTLLNLAYPDRVKPPAAEVPASAPVEPQPNTVKPQTVRPVTAGAATPQSPARQAEQAAAREEQLAEQRERAARTKELEAEARYRASLPGEREAARKAWLKAREQWEQARRDWDAARERWQAVRDQLDAPQQTPRIIYQTSTPRARSPQYQRATPTHYASPRPLVHAGPPAHRW